MCFSFCLNEEKKNCRVAWLKLEAGGWVTSRHTEQMSSMSHFLNDWIFLKITLVFTFFKVEFLTEFEDGIPTIMASRWWFSSSILVWGLIVCLNVAAEARAPAGKLPIHTPTPPSYSFLFSSTKTLVVNNNQKTFGSLMSFWRPPFSCQVCWLFIDTFGSYVYSSCLLGSLNWNTPSVFID